MGNDGALPFILAGPILRKVEPASACVWIALSHAARVTGFVYDATATEQFGEGNTNTLKLGNALYIALVQIKSTRTPTASGCGGRRKFPKRMLLAYDLIFELIGEDGKAIRGVQKRLLSNLTTTQHGRNALAYDPYSYPTFYIDDAGLNILHGSCRKAHGAGDDALASADTLLQAATPKPNVTKDLTKRPSTLFLTGDQIYADDVHDALITLASDLGRQLLGYDEYVPKVPVPVHLLNPKLRRELASKIFSPDKEAKNQLLGFGDFAGLYLLALNQEHWPNRGTLPTDLQRFYDALPAVRRALANLSTYMTMDDHEICDDWNISKTWEQRARGEDQSHNPLGALGKRVIAHGVCAYWAFQAWGNQPDKFDKVFRDTIEKYFADRESSGDAFESAFLKPQEKDRNRWFFIAPTTPPTFFLDSRTRRAASTARPEAPSSLMNDDALRDFYNAAQANKVSGDWLIVVAQTPVFGVPEDEAYIESHGFPQPEEKDNERWHSNRGGYYKLLRTLYQIGPRGCVILSGDLHYAFVAQATVSVDKGKPIPFIQFTSSALKNMLTGKKRAGLSAISDRPKSDEERGWLKAPRYSNQRAEERIREILRSSPAVLTTEEILIAAPIDKWDTEIAKQPVHPTQPTSGPYLHVQTNLAQLVLAPSGRATLRLYGAANAEPFATYDLWLGEPKSQQPSLPPIPDPMEIFFQKDRPRPEDLTDDLTVLTNEGLRNLSALAKTVRDDPTLNVHLTGRASIEGPPNDPEFNYDLGTRRAMWLAGRLKIDMSRIANPPGYSRGEDCREVSPGIVTCGAAEANLAIDPCDRHVLVEFFRLT